MFEEVHMRILFWMNTGFQTTSRHILISVLRALCEKGHKVTVIHKSENDNINILKDLNKYDIEFRAIDVKKAAKANLIHRYVLEWVYLLKSRRSIAKDFDVAFVQSSNMLGLYVWCLRNKNKKARIVLNVQDIFPINASLSGNLSKKGVPYKILSSLQRYAYKKASHIITISEDMKETLIEEGAEESKISVIYNWSYQDKPYDRRNIDFTNVSHMFSKEKFNVVYAGNIGVMQNVEIVVRTANLLKENRKIQFHIIGDGVHKDKLVAMARELSLDNISFWPMMSSDDAPAIYASADVNVIPLVKDVYKTALPSKTATCFACGKPIVFCIGNESKFVQYAKSNTNCLSVDSDDSIALKKVIISVCQNTKIIGYDKFFLENFSETYNSERYAECIGEVDYK